MRNLLVLLALIGLTIACGSDDASEGTLLRHDGDNNTAPFLPAGIHETAARFSSDVVRNFTGQQITELLYYIEDVPQDLEIRIYEGGATSPLALRYSEVVTGQTSSNEFNTLVLSEPFTIGTEAIWLAVRMTLTEEAQVIGCDAGPRNPNGDFIDFSLQGWSTFNALNSVESINWNIRGRVE